VRRQEDSGIQRQYLWNAPDGNQPDFTETFNHGEDILVSWNALNNSIYDLWLTSWNYDPDPVTLCIASKFGPHGTGTVAPCKVTKSANSANKRQ
jgi:hypothetical protein